MLITPYELINNLLSASSRSFPIESSGVVAGIRTATFLVLLDGMLGKVLIDNPDAPATW